MRERRRRRRRADAFLSTPHTARAGGRVRPSNIIAPPWRRPPEAASTSRRCVARSVCCCGVRTCARPARRRRRCFLSALPSLRFQTPQHDPPCVCPTPTQNNNKKHPPPPQKKTRTRRASPTPSSSTLSASARPRSSSARRRASTTATSGRSSCAARTTRTSRTSCKRCFCWFLVGLLVFLVASPAALTTLFIIITNQLLQKNKTTQKVTFNLHVSFQNPSRTIEKPPFELTETGWGEFEIGVVVRLFCFFVLCFLLWRASLFQSPSAHFHTTQHNSTQPNPTTKPSSCTLHPTRRRPTWSSFSA